MSDKLFRISTPTIKYTIDDEFDMSRVASSRFIICNMGNKNRIVKENPTIEGMAFRTDLTQEETKKLNAGIISAQIHILLNNHKVIWTDIAKTTMNGVLGEDMFDVPDYSADTGEYEIDFHGTVSDYDVPLHGHLDVTLEGSTVIPNPEGEATDDLTKVEIDGEIFLVKDSTIYDWARAEEKPTYTKAEVGLGNVDNTSDLNKPISTATQTALNGKVDKDGDKVLSDNNYSDTDKNKLDGIEAEANKTVVDNSVTSTSTNPVESKAIYNLLNDLLPEATATGNPIAITNASGLNAKSLKVELEPIQDLHGYDSPWVGGGGKNKFHNVVSSQTVNGVTITVYDDGTFKANGKPTVSTFILPLGTVSLKSNNTYIISGSQEGGGSSSYRLDGIKDGVTIDNWNDATKDSFTVEEDTEVTICLRISGDYTCNNLLFKPMVCLSTATNPREFAPYSNICPISGRTQTTVSVNSEDITIQFGQTVYGGEVDVTSGGTSVTNPESTKIKISALNWTYQDNFQRFYTSSLGSVIAPANNNQPLDNFVCECYETNSLNGYQDQQIAVAQTSGNVFVKDNNYTDVTTWLQAVGDYYISYPLRNPVTINTPATSISLNKGNNTLTADGDMELIYSKTPQ